MMRPFSLLEVTGWVYGTLTRGSGQITGISTDTRSLQPGDLFVALRGERFDGHDFLTQAQAGGAAAALVDTVEPGMAMPQIEVRDTLEGLGQLALANRRLSKAATVAVTGSCGKTTVKEMLAAILGEEGETLATQGNLNNHIGAPLTLMRLAPEHRFAVIELGASGIGEIDGTVRLTRPQVAVITNAGDAHLGGFGSYANIVEAKGEIIEGVPADGTVVLNRDDPAFATWSARAAGRKVVSVSLLDNTADLWASAIEPVPTGYRFTAQQAGGESLVVNLPLVGEHNILNALLAMAAARALGARDDAMSAGLAKLKPVSGRLHIVPLAEGSELIDDSYNANPASMKAALKTLAGRPGYRVAVLGAMAELGDASERLHADVGDCARELGIDTLIVVGECAKAYTKGYGADAIFCNDHATAIDCVQALHRQKTISVLVKGSRSAAMDAVARALTEKGN
ncbi:MAG: UDP-N-acetylmuramoyl-tripeptide--D-alanyl-D-alanine ligase [Marinobacter sp.]|nr:UDP-N-acetylmuramoyl-tripeptide--D-alanyl-D-alanine ligase [Marinobacter sp.]